MNEDAASREQLGPLHDVTVLDFTEFLAGPGCSLYLADFGARVIKVESPSGDKSRSWGDSRFGEDGDFSSLFLAMNRNKQGVALDLKSPAGRDAALRLASHVDVVIENFTPGVADRLGIGYEAVRSVRPDVVYCSVSGFGQTGPLAAERGVDLRLQAYAGLLSITGEPGGPPVRIGPSTIDTLAGTHGALGVLLALRHRDRTGEGQHIDTSLYDAALHTMTFVIADYTGTNRLPQKFGAYFPFAAPYGLYSANDKDFFLGVSGDDMWWRLSTALGDPDWMRDERFADNGSRVKHRAALHEILQPLFAAESSVRWAQVAHDAGIPFSLVNDVAHVVTQKQATEREMIVDTGIEGVRAAGVPIKLSRTPGSVRSGAPSQGADTVRVLTEFGFTPSEIEALRCPAGGGRGASGPADDRRTAGTTAGEWDA